MENTPGKNIESTHAAQNPSRRRLLKALAAGGVVTAAGRVPGKWSSPVLKSGVLPAHAQVTPTFNIACNPEWDIGGGDGFTIFNFSATATQNGSPLPNVVLKATVETTSETGTTDANGVADFSVSVNYDSFRIPPVASVIFDDQQTYPDSVFCSMIFQNPWLQDDSPEQDTD